MSEKKMTDEELAKISGAGDKTTSEPSARVTSPDPVDDSGGPGNPGDIDTDVPPADPADLNRN